MRANGDPDWRDGAAYAPLLAADRSLIAWEWLRRDGAYRAAADKALSGCNDSSPGGGPCARTFGLLAFEPSHLPVPLARPLWSSSWHSQVLVVLSARPAAQDDMFDIERLSDLARVESTQAGEHLLLSDGLRTIRLDGPRGAFNCGPRSLSYSLDGVRSAEASVMVLRRFLALARNGKFSASLHRSEPRARRWILMLRTADALAAGADQRQIAGELLSRSVREPCWRTRDSSIRSQVQRLVRSARGLMAGEYRLLLR